MAGHRTQFNAPKKSFKNQVSSNAGDISMATGACDVYFAGCVGTGTLQECTKICGGELATAKRAFRSQSGRQRRVVPARRSGQSVNSKFMMASGRSGAMSDFLHEVGLIVVGVGAWYFLAAPLLKKAGVKPLSI